MDYIDFGEAVELHDREIEETGGRFGFNGPEGEGLLRSALQRPIDMATYAEADLFEQAATLMFGIAKNHAFLDGNKRTALIVTDVFLQINGHWFTASNEELLAFLLQCDQPAFTVKACVEFVKEHSGPLP